MFLWIKVLMVKKWLKNLLIKNFDMIIFEKKTIVSQLISNHMYTGPSIMDRGLLA